MAGTPLLILDIEARSVTAEVRLNDVALHRSASYETINAGTRVNGWAVQGRNTLQVRLALPPGPPPEEAPPAVFELRLRRATPGTPDAADETLAEYRWTPAQPLGLGPTGVFATQFDLGAMRPWSWTSGYASTAVTGADRAGIAAVLRRLRDALAERRIEEVVDLQRVQVGEQSIAVGHPPDDMLDQYRAFLGERMGSGDWRVAPFDEVGFRTELMAEGRIVHVTAADGGPPIITDSRDGRFAIDPYLSKIDGRWTVVR